MKKLRMYYFILGTEPYYKEVSSVEEAKTMIDAIADFVNAKVEEGVFPDHCSTAGLEEYDEVEEEWVTWYDKNGYDFDEHFEEEASKVMSNEDKRIVLKNLFLNEDIVENILTDDMNPNDCSSNGAYYSICMECYDVIDKFDNNTIERIYSNAINILNWQMKNLKEIET